MQPIQPPQPQPQEGLLEQPQKVRLFFTKLDRAKYISHLDMNRCMSRALKRSGLPVWYTGGFNPHMYLTFPLPLSLGCESSYECVDLKMTREVALDSIAEKVNACLPPDIQVFAAGPQKMDIRPLFSVVSLKASEGTVLATMRFATGIEVNINPSLLLDNAPFRLDVRSLKRVMVYNKQMQPFC